MVSSELEAILKGPNLIFINKTIIEVKNGLTVEIKERWGVNLQNSKKMC